MVTSYGTPMSQFKAMVEIFCKLANVSAKYSEEYGYIELHKNALKYKIQFLNEKFDHADVFVFDADEEMYKHLKTYTDGYEFIANI